MLSISHGTLQNLRITRSLPYTKLGGIMFYKFEDIQKILEAGLVSKKYIFTQWLGIRQHHIVACGQLEDSIPRTQ